MASVQLSDAASKRHRLHHDFSRILLVLSQVHKVKGLLLVLAALIYHFEVLVLGLFDQDRFFDVLVPLIT